MEYAATLTVTRPSATTPDDLGGQTATGSETLYDGDADVQDLDLRFAATTRGEAVAYLPTAVTGIAVGDDASVLFADGTTTGYRVSRVRRLDDALELERL